MPSKIIKSWSLVHVYTNNTNYYRCKLYYKDDSADG